ncbi:MAG: hypothetical protein M3271_09505, partial [Actinomycetota bacterium]|nr:hypothetical protein [Actinomycetota bacterium]
KLSRSLLAGMALVAGLAAPSGARGCHVPPPPGSPSACGLSEVGSVEVSEAAGAGRVEVHGKLAAVLQRDEGIVSLVDVSKPARPKVLGRYDGGLEQQRAGKSLDGDLAFSSDGKWLFYARQSTQLSADGLHVLDVSDPAAPALRHYQPEGGTFRVAVHETESATYVITMDAIEGLVINRFDPSNTAGLLVPVYSDPQPALRRVGGPASAGLFVDPADPKLGVPVLYASSGTTGLQVYDLSTPEQPALLGSWGETGLAEVEVVRTKTARTVYAATEYWFNESLEPEVVVLDATDLGAIAEKKRIGLNVAAAEEFRIQGMVIDRGRLWVAHSSIGLVGFDRGGHPVAYLNDMGDRNEGSTEIGQPYTFDVEAAKGLLYATDAATGRLAIVRAGR